MSHIAHDSDHDHQLESDTACGSCCSGPTIEPTQIAAKDGLSFHVSGLDCAEEVSILNRVVGPEVGGAEFLAFDVINARMTVLEPSVPSDRIVALVATTGMTAKPWNADDANQDQAAHLKSQKRFTALSGGFWLSLIHI